MGGTQRINLNCSSMNFPYKCFYNPDEQLVFSFYRQGHAITVPYLEQEKQTVLETTDRQCIMFESTSVQPLLPSRNASRNKADSFFGKPSVESSPIFNG